MRVIITGGTGLIGRALAKNLANDYEVVVLSRSPQKYADSMPDGVKLEKWDAKTAEGWGHLADGAHAIINLAGAGIADKRWSPARKELIMNSRISAGEAVIAAVRQATNKPNVVLQSSAIGYYGTSDSTVFTERHAAGNDFTAEVCVAWEKVAEPIAEMGVRLVTLRTGIVLSTQGGALEKLMIPFNIIGGGALGDGMQWMSWVHIDDQVGAMRFLMEEQAANGIYNISAPNPVHNRTMTQKIGTVMNRPIFPSAPAFILKTVLGEMATVIIDGQHVVPERLIKQGYHFQYSDVETALRDLIPNEK